MNRNWSQLCFYNFCCFISQSNQWSFQNGPSAILDRYKFEILMCDRTINAQQWCRLSLPLIIVITNSLATQQMFWINCISGRYRWSVNWVCLVKLASWNWLESQKSVGLELQPCLSGGKLNVETHVHTECCRPSFVSICQSLCSFVTSVPRRSSQFMSTVFRHYRLDFCAVVLFDTRSLAYSNSHAATSTVIIVISI